MFDHFQNFHKADDTELLWSNQEYKQALINFWDAWYWSQDRLSGTQKCLGDKVWLVSEQLQINVMHVYFSK